MAGAPLPLRSLLSKLRSVYSPTLYQSMAIAKAKHEVALRRRDISYIAVTISPMQLGTVEIHSVQPR